MSVNGLCNIAIDMTVIFLYCMTKMLIMHMTNFYEDSLYSSCFCSFINFFFSKFTWLSICLVLRVSEWLLLNAKWLILQLYQGDMLHFDNMMLSFALNRPTRSVFIMVSQWNNSPQVDMSLHIILNPSQPVASLTP